MKNNQKGSVGIFAIVWVVVAFAAAYGWVNNIISLLSMSEGITGLLIARVVGIFVAPLGAVLGYI